jgi:hypothetical protein
MPRASKAMLLLLVPLVGCAPSGAEYGPRAGYGYNDGYYGSGYGRSGYYENERARRAWAEQRREAREERREWRRERREEAREQRRNDGYDPRPWWER